MIPEPHGVPLHDYNWAKSNVEKRVPIAHFRIAIMCKSTALGYSGSRFDTISMLLSLPLSQFSKKWRTPMKNKKVFLPARRVWVSKCCLPIADDHCLGGGCGTAVQGGSPLPATQLIYYELVNLRHASRDVMLSGVCGDLQGTPSKRNGRGVRPMEKSPTATSREKYKFACFAEAK